MLTPEKLSYYSRYIYEIDKARRQNVISRLYEISDLINHLSPKRIEVKKASNKISMVVYAKKRFKNLYNMTLYREELNKLMTEARQKGFHVFIRNEIQNADKEVLELSIAVERAL